MIRELVRTCLLTGLVLLGLPPGIQAQLRERLGLTPPAPRLSSLGGYYGYFPTSWRPWPSNEVTITSPMLGAYTTPGNPSRLVLSSPTPLPTHAVGAPGAQDYALRTSQSVPSTPGSATIIRPFDVATVPTAVPAPPLSSNIRIRESDQENLAPGTLLLPAVPNQPFAASSAQPIPWPQPTGTSPLPATRRILRLHLPEEGNEKH